MGSCFLLCLAELMIFCCFSSSFCGTFVKKQIHAIFKVREEATNSTYGHVLADLFPLIPNLSACFSGSSPPLLHFWVLFLFSLPNTNWHQAASRNNHSILNSSPTAIHSILAFPLPAVNLSILTLLPMSISQQSSVDRRTDKPKQIVLPSYCWDMLKTVYEIILSIPI